MCILASRMHWTDLERIIQFTMHKTVYVRKSVRTNKNRRKNKYPFSVQIVRTLLLWNGDDVAHLLFCIVCVCVVLCLFFLSFLSSFYCKCHGVIVAITIQSFRLEMREYWFNCMRAFLTLSVCVSHSSFDVSTTESKWMREDKVARE